METLETIRKQLDMMTIMISYICAKHGMMPKDLDSLLKKANMLDTPPTDGIE